jgi:integrase
MKKRGNGEGTFFKRRDSTGKVVGYRAGLIVGNKLDGKLDRRWVSGRTADEVRRKLDELKTARNSGVIWSSERLTVGDFLSRWTEHKRTDGTRLKTVSRYEQVVRRQLVPTLGRIALEKLAPLDVEAALQTIRAASSAKAARRARTTLSMALNQAIRWRIIPFNVCHSVKPPAIPHDEEGEVRYWTAQEVVLVLEAVASHRLYALFHLAVMTGLRPCELLGLRWKDVDFDNTQIRVEQNAVTIQGKMHLGPVKTKASRRTVTIPLDTVVALRQHAVVQQGERERLAAPSPDALRMRERRLTPAVTYSEHDLVFANELGSVMNYNNLYRLLKAVIGRTNVNDIGLHGLRHTHASILILRGVNAKVVSERLGHKDVAFTLRIYAHLFEEQRRAAAMDIETFLGTPMPSPETTAPVRTTTRVLN